ncbi:MAG: DNA polymerase III subunit delta [Mariprofundaceae bacterium]|nr:DNA polymerase III subunit delta [Mariprofundaceae bacterium]
MSNVLGRFLGHRDVFARFLNALSKGQLHHAWLLHGPSGIGKATLGFEMARAYLCEKNRHSPPAHEACGTCHVCHMMAAGSHPDFLQVEREWDEKKKRLKRDVHVGQTRDLLSFLSLSGSQSERKVVLVREAGQMNAQAANALLKGLEEPAPGSLLILACEDTMSVPVTVRSRCLLQALAPLGDDECRSILCDMGLDGEVLEFAVKLADGQPGKASPLTDADVADALLDWERLTRDMSRADIGHLQGWISRHVRQIPHALLVDVVLNQLEGVMQENGNFHAFDTLMAVAHDLAAWPVEVARRTLNPASTLLAHMLSLRIALRAFENTLGSR